MVQDGEGEREDHQTNRAALRGHTNFPEATPSSRSIVRLRTPSRRGSRLGVALLMVTECLRDSRVVRILVSAKGYFNDYKIFFLSSCYLFTVNSFKKLDRRAE